jgi:hypothetical protein
MSDLRDSLAIAKNAMKTPKPSGGMQLDEALKILNVSKETPKEDVVKVSPCSSLN